MGSSPELRLPGRASAADHSHMHGLHQQALQHLVAGYGGQAGALGLLGSPGQHRGQASLGSVRSTGSEGHEPAGEGLGIITLTCVRTQLCGHHSQAFCGRYCPRAGGHAGPRQPKGRGGHGREAGPGLPAGATGWHELPWQLFPAAVPACCCCIPLFACPILTMSQPMPLHTLCTATHPGTMYRRLMTARTRPRWLAHCQVSRCRESLSLCAGNCAGASLGQHRDRLLSSLLLKRTASAGSDTSAHSAPGGIMPDRYPLLRLLRLCRALQAPRIASEQCSGCTPTACPPLCAPCVTARCSVQRAVPVHWQPCPAGCQAVGATGICTAASALSAWKMAACCCKSTWSALMAPGALGSGCTVRQGREWPCCSSLGLQPSGRGPLQCPSCFQPAAAGAAYLQLPSKQLLAGLLSSYLMLPIQAACLQFTCHSHRLPRSWGSCQPTCTHPEAAQKACF